MEYLIRQNLSVVKVFEKYNKYSCKSDITSAWFKKDNGDFVIYRLADKSISLERGFDICVQFVRMARHIYGLILS
ncbi:hypothetical protein SAMN05216249_1094 [Acetitomaculum ruminis DSM 5522]|uniref:Uncharacterized protein n=1 Tax=Acetitomaculum ruminis DSM 5522 TaxID=1120918 RepID=A0A1I0Y783_9FIRM|nr:hypothetical protein [Acetitomaculum ruminis]SFB09159.1 hypothetical protein SAMN05216249_1094 [Acetitomaculum ruminis DSM 5522]